MSYILDALRKSESERRQGRVPDLGQQVHFVHKPRKKSSSLVILIGAGLLVNAVVLAFVFWPDSASEPVPAEEPAELAQNPEPESGQSEVGEPMQSARNEPDPEPEPEPEPEAPASQQIPETAPVVQQSPTIIVPSRPSAQSASQSSGYVAPGTPGARVPHLVEMPLAFQKSIPDLVFNSHIFASEPSSRRVMINNSYLKAGDSFDGIRVQQITEEGVVLSSNGRSFRVGIVRDWKSPE